MKKLSMKFLKCSQYTLNINPLIVIGQKDLKFKSPTYIQNPSILDTITKYYKYIYFVFNN